MTRYLQKRSLNLGGDLHDNGPELSLSYHIISFLVLPLPYSRLLVSPWKELVHISGVPTFVATIQGTQYLRSPASGGQWGLWFQVSQDYSKQGSTHNPTETQWRVNRQKSHVQVFPWKKYICILQMLLPEDLVSNQPVSRCWLRYSPLEHWHTLNCWNPPPKKGGLYTHKCVRGNQKIKLNCTIRFISYMIPLHKDWKGDFYLRCRKQ